RGADAGDLRRGHRGADTRAADQHAALGGAGEDRLADVARLVGVVDSRLGRIGAEIDDLVPEASNGLEDPLPQLHSPMVKSDGDAHSSTLPRRGFVDSRA